MHAHILLAVFIAATLVQLAAWIVIFARLALHRPTQNSKLKTQNSKLSVLICARNEAENLRKNLPAVLEQQYPDFEVLVVDDDSTDDTPAVLHFFQEKYPCLRVLRISPKTTPGKKHALAQGIAAARHEHLVFTDADCRPAGPEWLEVLSFEFRVTQNSKLKTQHSKPEILLGYAPYHPAPGLLNRWIRFETVHTAMQYFSFALAGIPYMGVGRNMAWHKSLFRRVGGFDAHSDLPSGDDDLLVNAAATDNNTAICLNPKAFVFSEPEKTWRDLWRQKRRHLSAGVRYRPLHRMMLGALALSQVLHYFLLTPLCFSGFGTICVSLWSIRMAPAFLIYWKILRQFREEQLLIWFPLFDALLAFYYAVVVPPVLIRSNSLISWK
jgi:biofilm PGA synthesis N-glycosyltransferase PgaC